MNVLHMVSDAINWMGWYILPFVAIMSAIVFFHELGHYSVGRWCGVKIEAFSLGFGPELLHWVDGAGTRWRLALFPIGGYVKFLGDADAASTPDSAAVVALSEADRHRTLAGQPLLNRAAIVERLIAAEGEALLLCAGSEGRLSFEDILCAGAIVDALVRHDKQLAITDAARAAATIYAANAKRLTTAIASGTHARELVEKGFAGDVASCAKIDVSGCVPLYADGVIAGA